MNIAPIHAKSQNARILQYLKQGNVITWMVAYKLFGTNCLPRRILDLKKEGHDIKSNIVKLDNGKRIAEYYLPNSSAEQTELF